VRCGSLASATMMSRGGEGEEATVASWCSFDRAEFAFQNRTEEGRRAEEAEELEEESDGADGAITADASSSSATF
jgi:hypothetical protein